METPFRRIGALAAAALFVAAACSSGATTAPSAAPSTAASPSAAASMAASPSAAATSPSAAPSQVATVPSDQLIFPGKLVVCSDIPYPPQEFFDQQGSPTGSDIEIAQAIGQRLGLTVQIENAVFDTIIAAVTGGKCDIIVSAQNITPDRVKQVDMIPYFTAGQSFVVDKGNPDNINTTDDLCGKAIAAETGTTEVDYLNGTGDYKGQGLSAACVSKGKGKIDVKEFPKDTDALAALLGGQVAAYFADSPVAGYYTVEHPDQFQLSGVPPLASAIEGISVPKDKTGLRDAVQQALLSMVNDGTYMAILQKFGVESGAVTAADVNTVNKTGS
jgi:polar amino acid transport system substrate-binding protein